jgi:hypothetical protein
MVVGCGQMDSGNIPGHGALRETSGHSRYMTDIGSFRSTDQKVAGSNPAERAGKAQVKPYYRQSVDLRVPLVAEARTPTVLGKFPLNATVPLSVRPLALSRRAICFCSSVKCAPICNLLGQGNEALPTHRVVAVTP